MATSVLCCLRCCRDGGTGHIPLKEMPAVQLDTQHMGIWGIGVATQKVNLNQIPLGRDVHSLVMRNDGALYHNNEEKNRLPANSLPQEGDVVLMTVQFWIASSVNFIIRLHLVLKKYYLNSRSSECICF
ncbi:SPRY domain-containing protein 7 isoform X4 [Macaca fascicularis]|uniref:SPRY domain-containing protein 7 isoform X4 n=1 Tax=Macaca fascicularis TaxID=9541 RepID=UPI003D15C1D2